MRKLLYFISISIFTITNGLAQDVGEFKWFGDYYEDEMFISLGANKISVTNSDIFNSENHKISGTTIKLDVKQFNFEKGARSWSYESKLLGDVIWFGAKAFKDPDEIYADEETALTSGFIGWYTTTWNITEARVYQISVGANIKDFNLLMTEPKDKNKPFSNPGNIVINEPAGNYYTIGPSIAARYNLFNKIMFEYHSDLSIPFGKLESSSNNFIEDKDFKNPYFINHVIELVSSKGLFVGYEYLSIIQRTKRDINPVRNELFIGFRIRV